MTATAPVRAARWPAWLTLFLLAPLLGEIVSGHQPPGICCGDPLSVLLLMVPYGFGAILCRELTRRWKKGWLSLLLLAVAYGVYEEGMVVRSFFNPDWLELDAMRAYHWLGLNWTWSFAMVHFHVLASICGSVFLAEIIHADRRHEPWIGTRGWIANGIGLALWLPTGWLMTQYLPPAGWIAATLIAFAGLVGAARLLPADIPRPRQGTAPHPLLFLALGFANMTTFFVTAFFLPEIWPAPLWLAFSTLALIDLATLLLLLRLSAYGGAWDDRHRLAWVAGGQLFFILYGVLEDLESPAGRAGVSMLALFALSMLAAAVIRRRRESKRGLPPAPSPTE